MGMDVYGKKPTSEAGKYFRNNVWWWRPLWDYCVEICRPGDTDIIDAKTAKGGHYNDGHGLNADRSIRLADKLQVEIDSGRAAARAAERETALKVMPDISCDLCEGTGRRVKAPHAGAGPYGCNGCGGEYVDSKPSKGKTGIGKVRPSETQYPFSVENVQEFIAFLRDSGGFKIC